MKRPSPEDRELWRRVQSTIRPLQAKASPGHAHQPALWKMSVDLLTAMPGQPRGPLENIEPNRGRRLERERDELEARLDLHGLDHDRARANLERFLLEAWRRNHRAVLVITGKGEDGVGVLRRALPGWLAAPGLREIVAGLSQAHRRHGGEGAFYVALKRGPHAR
ncbi:MAG: mismatch repair protein MutS [Caulobacteraceae bacterium]|nr:mismatch repair protein MutS [Caulobacteraceae bacterium]